MEPFEKITGYFKPKIMKTLRKEAVPLVGQLMDFEALWLIGEDDGGPYVGQWAMRPLDRDGNWLRGIGWVPEEDIDLKT